MTRFAVNDRFVPGAIGPLLRDVRRAGPYHEYEREGAKRFLLLLAGVAWLFVSAGLVSSSQAVADDKDACKPVADNRAIATVIAACTRIIEDSATSAQDRALAYNSRGNAYYSNGDKVRAIADYNAAIRLDPGLGDAYDNRGNAYGDKGDYDRAIADYNEAIRLDPKNAFVYNERGNAYHAKGNNNRAIADYDAAIGLDANYSVAYNDRGAAYHDTGDDGRAIADYDVAIRLDPEYALAYANRGIAYSAKGDYDRAVADYEAVIRLLSNAPASVAALPTTPNLTAIAPAPSETSRSGPTPIKPLPASVGALPALPNPTMAAPAPNETSRSGPTPIKPRPTSVGALPTPAPSSAAGQVVGGSSYNFKRNFGVGSTGDGVSALQRLLAKTGIYKGPITGYFGRTTRAAVEKYQGAHNIVPTSGYVGSLTRASLNRGRSSEPRRGRTTK